MIDWKKGPGLKLIKQLELQLPIQHKLSNGISTYTISGGTQAVTKIDIVFTGGRILEFKKLTSRFVASLLREGTVHSTASQLAEILDYYGVNIKSASNLDYNYISFSCLNKHIDQVIPLVCEMILEPTFEQSEIDSYRRKCIDNLSMDLSKSELIAYRELTSQLYGDDHPYGYNTEKSDLLNITQADIIQQYERSIGVNNCFAIITGLPSEHTVDLLDKHLGQLDRIITPQQYTEPTCIPKSKIVSCTNEYQAALKVGRRVMIRHHEDYPAFFVMNTVLGGYFGSRLMSEVRENQGLTYNIYSTVDNLKHDSYFYIATEVDHKSIEQVVLAIKDQITLLQTAYISDEELAMVKNYMMGTFLNLVDGPFLYGALMRALLAEGSNIEEFMSFYANIQKTTKEDILNAAQIYLREEDLTTIVVTKQ